MNFTSDGNIVCDLDVPLASSWKSWTILFLEVRGIQIFEIILLGLAFEEKVSRQFFL
jgi:hypothetical protein